MHLVWINAYRARAFALQQSGCNEEFNFEWLQTFTLGKLLDQIVMTSMSWQGADVIASGFQWKKYHPVWVK